jgi:hypothetical protein
MPLPVYIALLLVLPVLKVGLTVATTVIGEYPTRLQNPDIVDILGLNATEEIAFPLHSYTVGFTIQPFICV